MKNCLYCKNRFRPNKYSPEQSYCSADCARRRTPLVDRFWKRVTKTPSCWLWKQGKTPYGTLTITIGGQERPYGAHRISWLLHFGPIPDSFYVCHSCNVKRCVNPHHLYLGTPKDNSCDAAKDKLSPFGERVWKSKLKETDVLFIISALRGNPRDVSELANKFNVDICTIYDIREGRSWKHLTQKYQIATG